MMKKINELDLKILIVDDEEIIRDSFREYLELYDFYVIEADNGLLGYELILNEKPDLVIMDLRMPKLDGFELLKKISNFNFLLPVIVISATGAIQDAVNAVRMGAWDFLIKPFSDFSLLDYAIERVIEKYELMIKNQHYQEKLEQLVEERTKELQKTNVDLIKMNEILRVNKEKMELALSGGNLGLWDLDLTRKVMDLSEHVFEMLGYDPDSISNHYQFWVDFIEKNEFQNEKNHVKRYLNINQSHFEFENMVNKKDGKTIWILIKGKVIERKNDGTPSRLTGTVLNINERKQAEERILNLNKELEIRVKKRTKELEESLTNLRETQNQLIQSEKQASLGRLVAGVAHEINTPMGIAVSLASNISDQTNDIFDLIQKKAIKKSRFEDYLSIMKESSEMILSNMNRASQLIRSFKNIAVEESSIELIVFNLYEYINDLIISLNTKIKKYGHEIFVELDSNLRLKSYPGVFSQILTNLIMNSIHHGYEHGITGKLTIKGELTDKHFFLKYFDDGKGISNENLKKIFDPFFTTKRNQGGSGLGLNIVYNLVTGKLNGQIDCFSEPDKGTKFVITLSREVIYE